MTVTDDDTSGLAALATRLLDEEETRAGNTVPTAGDVADESLPGVGGEEMGLRQVLRTGGVSTVVVLTLLNIVDEFDRIAMAILGPDIQRTFGLNDTGLAALNGVGAVAVFCGAIPLGLLADRRRRTALVGATATLWAAFALLGGLARSAWQLGATRVVNGLGKGNSPVINSILSDRYPIEGRSRIFALYNLGNPVGNLVGPLLAAGVAAAAGGTEGWRWSLMILAIPAIALALAAFALPEPARGANEKQALGMAEDAVGSDPIPMAAAFERLRQIKTFAALMSALAMLGLALTGAGAIFNLLLEREYGLDGVGRGVVASITSIGGFLGLLIGARVGDKLFQRDPARVLRFVAVDFALLGVFYTAGIRMPEVWMLIVFHFLAAGAVTAALTSSSALIPSIVPYRMRGISFAVVGLYLVFVGGLVGGVLTGMLSDAVGGRTALTILLPIGCSGAAAYLWTGSRHVRHDMALVVEELREEEAERERLSTGDGTDDMLQVRNLDVSYGPVQVLFGVEVTVRRGETLALLGTNGAGKSTLLRAISGLTLPHRGVVRFDGRTITYTDPTDRVRRGIVQVAGGKAVFAALSVRENLLAGAHTFIWEADRVERRSAEVLELFPALVPLLDQPAGTLSGGEQQMLALAKALLLEPEILLIDELSLGLAPVAVQEILATVDRLKEAGLTMVIVEQSINVALAVADRAVFMEKGRVRFEGLTADLLERDDLVRAVFLGAEGG